MTDIEAARLAADLAAARLHDTVLAACPGPHHLVQHRDGRRPWCPACRRHQDGQPVLDVPLAERRGVRTATPPTEGEERR